MSDDFNKNKQQEIDDFLNQFNEITEGLNIKSDDKKEEAISEFLTESEDQPQRMTRSERLKDEKQKKRDSNKLSAVGAGISGKIKSAASGLKDKSVERNTNDGNMEGSPSEAKSDMSGKRRKKKKYKLNIKKIIRNLFILGIVFCLIIGAWVASIIMKLPPINPDNIYSMLSESSVLYDDEENIIATVGSSETRTNVEYQDLPDHLVDAFISIEDKTFETHKGFNIIRIFGAIKDAMFNGGHIGGTSTITQQLARNIYLSSERSMERKIAEAYYTIIIEKELSKELIMEAYLNTINFGFDSYGVQTAAQSYFSKDVNELTLIESAALAALPKAPSDYALIKKLDPESVDPETHVIIHEGDDYTYVYNGDASARRRNQVLANMCEFGYITEEEKEAALAEDLLTHMNPNMRSLNEVSSYFADYVINEVINDYAELHNLKYAEAKEKIYSSGLRIHTTMDSDIQKILDEEFSYNSNFPKVANLSKDRNGNLLGGNGKILLYDYNHYFSEDGTFTFADDEYKWLDNGDLMLYGGKRLNFYKTTVQGEIDISIEFKN
ncbi:MAG: transglycosylase domain-containing protein, partial [Firmicutes bacterium]|nr:transglycosylase domain-containing protein [Bacillota bacterium]